MRNRVERVASIDTKRIRGAVYVSDALDLLSTLRTGSATLVFLDPPFNLGKKYEGCADSDSRPQRAYEYWLYQLVDEAARILAPGGALFFYHLPYWALRAGSHLVGALEFRHWIAIAMKNGFVRGRRLYPAHYSLLYMTKGSPTAFRRPRIKPSRCRHCGGVVKDYGGYWPLIQRRGINLSDCWDDLSPVRHKRYKLRGANELPQLLVDRVVAISGRPSGVFVDPFCGTGRAVVAAARIGMRVIAGDVSRASARLTAMNVTRLVPSSATALRRR